MLVVRVLLRDGCTGRKSYAGVCAGLDAVLGCDGQSVRHGTI